MKTPAARSLGAVWAGASDVLPPEPLDAAHRDAVLEGLDQMKRGDLASDDEIAAILSWVSAQGDSKPPPVIAASDVAAARGRTLNAAGVAQERKALAAAHPLP